MGLLQIGTCSKWDWFKFEQIQVTTGSNWDKFQLGKVPVGTGYAVSPIGYVTGLVWYGTVLVYPEQFRVWMGFDVILGY